MASKTSRIPFRRNQFFQGRGDLLARLSSEFESRTELDEVPPALLVGLGGIGKTQVAVEYAYRELNRLTFIFWVFAISTDSVEASLYAAGKSYGILSDADTDLHQSVSKLLTWLGGQRDWLMVFDNATDQDTIARYVPRPARGRVLITSRNRHFETVGVRQPTEVLVFTEDESRAFYLHRTNRASESRSEELRAIADLSTRLGGLPLALEQAAAYIAETQVSFGDYLRLYDTLNLKLLEKRKPVIGGYMETVATTWLINFRELHQRSRKASELLRQSAFWSHDRIPFELVILGAKELSPSLRQLFTKGRTDVSGLLEPLSLLSRYSLISINTLDRSYSLHPLVREVIVNLLPVARRRTFLSRAIRALLRICPAVQDNPYYRYLTPRLINHLLACRDSIVMLGLSDKHANSVFNIIGDYYSNISNYLEARGIYEVALQRWNALGGDTRAIIARTTDNLAWTFHNLGDQRRAKSLYISALDTHEELDGYSSASVAWSLNGLASAMRGLGEHEVAEHLYKRALTITEGVEGKNNNRYAMMLNNLALAYLETDRPTKAEPLLLQAIAFHKTYFKVDPGAVARDFGNIAHVYDETDRHDEAFTCLMDAYAILRDHYGEEHIETARTKVYIGEHLCEYGDAQEGERLIREAIPIIESRAGKRNTPYLNALLTLALSEWERGETDQGIKKLEETVSLLGVSSEITTIFKHYKALIHVLEKEERLNDAIRYAQLYTNMLQEKVGISHTKTLEAAGILESLYVQNEQYEEAEGLCRIVIEVVTRTFGSDSRNLVPVLVSYGELLRKVGRNKEAESVEVRITRLKGSA